MKTRLHVIAVSALLLVGLVGCSKKHDHHDHDHGHAHAAPHGGTLVELGDHQYNLELVRDAAAGTLTAYVLDGHAENFVRVAMPGFVITATVEGRREILALAALANPATGETIGETSAFVAAGEWLKTTDTFEGVITGLEVRGLTFTDVAFKFPK